MAKTKKWTFANRIPDGPKKKKRKPRPPPKPVEYEVLEHLPDSMLIRLGRTADLLHLQVRGSDPINVELLFGGFGPLALLHCHRFWLPKNRFPKPKEVVQFAEDILIPEFMDKLKGVLLPRGGFAPKKVKKS